MTVGTKSAFVFVTEELPAHGAVPGLATWKELINICSASHCSDLVLKTADLVATGHPHLYFESTAYQTAYMKAILAIQHDRRWELVDRFINEITTRAIQHNVETVNIILRALKEDRRPDFAEQLLTTRLTASNTKLDSMSLCIIVGCVVSSVDTPYNNDRAFLDCGRMPDAERVYACIKQRVDNPSPHAATLLFHHIVGKDPRHAKRILMTEIVPQTHGPLDPGLLSRASCLKAAADEPTDLAAAFARLSLFADLSTLLFDEFPKNSVVLTRAQKTTVNRALVSPGALAHLSDKTRMRLWARLSAA